MFNHLLAVHVHRMDHHAHVLKTRQYIVFLLSSCAFYALNADNIIGIHQIHIYAAAHFPLAHARWIIQ